MIATTNWAMPEDYPEEEFEIPFNGVRFPRARSAFEQNVERIKSARSEVHTVQIDAARAMELQALFNKPEDWN